MKTEAQLLKDYKKEHGDLSNAYYSGKTGLTKAAFDILHGQIWPAFQEKRRAAGYLPPKVVE